MYYYMLKDLGWAFIESKDKRMVEDGRGHWRPSDPVPLLKQGHLEPCPDNF